MLSEALTSFERVILDSPPLTAVTDAAIVAPQVDGTIVVTWHQRTSRDALKSVLRQLRDVAANMLGGIVNGAGPSGGGYAYRNLYYYKGGDYYQQGGRESQEIATG